MFVAGQVVEHKSKGVRAQVVEFDSYDLHNADNSTFKINRMRLVGIGWVDADEWQLVTHPYTISHVGAQDLHQIEQVWREGFAACAQVVQAFFRDNDFASYGATLNRKIAERSNRGRDK